MFYLITSTSSRTVRSENAVLQKRVKELAAQVKILTIEKASLLAEVEIYRAEHSEPQQQPGTASNTTTTDNIVDHPFVQSGNGIYCSHVDIALNDLHNGCNPLCVALDPTGTHLASGGADRSLVVSQWGAATETDGSVPTQNTARWSTAAPVIALAWAPTTTTLLFLAVGCMDGTVQLLHVNNDAQQQLAVAPTLLAVAPKTHGKYCKHVVWCGPTVLATAAADGDVHLYRVMASTTTATTLEHVTSFHLGASIESATWVGDCSSLVVYTRETTYLHVFDLAKSPQQENSQDNEVPRSTIPLNDPTNNCAGDQHVSFAVLAMAVHGKYVACATDANRHLVVHVPTGHIVRNLYGHDADAYSSPVLAWSHSGQYIYCNTQHAATLVVYELASGQIVASLERHRRPIKDIYSSPTSDLIVTTSYDRKIVVWCTTRS